jgi:hypothetical protein
MLRAMHDAMLRDPTIRARVLADSALRAQQQHLEAMGAADSVSKAAPTKKPGADRPSRPAPASRAKPAAPKVAPKAVAKPADPHAGHVVPPARPPV